MAIVKLSYYTSFSPTLKWDVLRQSQSEERQKAATDYLWFHINIINNYVGHGTKRRRSGISPSSCAHSGCRVGWRARTLFIFWQRAFNTQPDPAEKISINNPSDRQKLRCVLGFVVVGAGFLFWVGESSLSRAHFCVQYLYLFFVSPFTEVCVNIHWTLSLPFSLRQKTDIKKKTKKRNES